MNNLVVLLVLVALVLGIAYLYTHNNKSSESNYENMAIVHNDDDDHDYIPESDEFIEDPEAAFNMEDLPEYAEIYHAGVGTGPGLYTRGRADSSLLF
jgi:cbb3-type cytochrome oxidase subunit 3